MGKPNISFTIIFIIICLILVDFLKAEKAADPIQQIQELKKKIVPASGEEKLNSLIRISALYFPVNPKEAMNYAQQALKVSREIRDIDDIVRALYLMGIIHSSSQKYHEALDIFQQALVIKEKTNDFRWIGIVCKEIGNIYLFTERINEAEKFLTRAHEIFRRINDKDLLLESYYLLAKLNAIMGDSKKTLQYNKQFDRLSKEILNGEKISRLQRVQKRVEVVKKDMEVQIQKLKLKKKKLLWNVGLFSLCLLVIILFMLIRKYHHLFTFWQKEKMKTENK